MPRFLLCVGLCLFLSAPALFAATAVEDTLSFTPFASATPTPPASDQSRPGPGMNLVRNASFELAPAFSGTPMRQGSEFYQMFVKDGNFLRWTPLNTEGWWVEGPSAEGVAVVRGEAHSGSHSLKIDVTGGKSRAVTSAFNRMLPVGPVTLSAWVKTRGCRGRLDLNLVAGWDSAGNPTLKHGVALPSDTDWTRLSVTATSPSLLQALARVQVDSGTLWLDDVQIEAGPTASTFNVRPEEWLRLSLEGVDDAVLAKWLQGDATPRRVTVHVDSRTPVRGTVVLRMGPWNRLDQSQLARFDNPRGPQSFTFTTADLAPDAYVLTAELQDQGRTVASGRLDFAPEGGMGGVASNGSLRSRTAVRYAIAPATPPARIFGIGNGMLQMGGGDWFGGWTLASFAEGRPLHLTTTRFSWSSDETSYLAAAAGVTVHSMGPNADGVPDGHPELANPASPNMLDLFNPQGWAAMLQRAEDLGRQYAADPFVVSYEMHNESSYLDGGQLCPSVYADASFRAWCRQRFNHDLSALNSHWDTSFTSWDQVEQIDSASFAAQVKAAAAKTGAAATDWMANTGTFSDQVMARMREHPAWSMDWMRWWAESSLRMYVAFMDRAHQYDHKTLYSNNLCWPAFEPQVNMPYLRHADNAQIDVQYTSGMPRSLGTPSEMMDSMEMMESVSAESDKPFWGIEIYYQPQWPGQYIALQNWGLLAHGMDNDMTFDWKPYSDYGPVKGTRAWEQPDANSMWAIIDNDGTKLPAYWSWVHSLQEIRAFHRRFDGFSLHRAATTVGLYVSPDTDDWVMCDTGYKPWNSIWQRTRNSLVFALRLQGVTVRYVDDATLPSRPGALQTLIVPAAYVLNQGAAAKLASFAKAGGTVILAGMTGVVDPWLAKYPNVGGPAWADLHWQAPDFTLENANQVYVTPPATGGPSPFRGSGFGTMPGATVLTDAQGATLGWERSWGQGKLLAYGIVPDSYSTDPHVVPEMSAWLEQWQKYVTLPSPGRWVGGDPRQAGLVGEGSEVVEVVVREKSPTEKFVFCLNQGGAGDGAVEIPVTPGTWRVTDGLSGQPVAGAVTAGVWKMPLHLEALGYRVLRFVRQ